VWKVEDPSVERTTRIWPARPIRGCSWDGAVRRQETIGRDSLMVLPPAHLKKRHVSLCPHLQTGKEARTEPRTCRVESSLSIINEFRDSARGGPCDGVAIAHHKSDECRWRPESEQCLTRANLWWRSCDRSRCGVIRRVEWVRAERDDGEKRP
jgi:hypothetical protein